MMDLVAERGVIPIAEPENVDRLDFIVNAKTRAESGQVGFHGMRRDPQRVSSVTMGSGHDIRAKDLDLASGWPKRLAGGPAPSHPHDRRVLEHLP